MKQTIVTTILLSAVNFAWASGGISIDNVEKHTNANNWIMTPAERVEIMTQGQTIKTNTVISINEKSFVYTEAEESLYDDLGS